MNDEKRIVCPDCREDVTRRDFVKAVGATALAAGSVPLFATPRQASAAPTPKSAAETSVKRFYDSLSESQQKAICFPFNHQLRKKISANWHITKPRIGDDFYSDDQRKLIDDIFKGVTSEDGYSRLHQQMKDDNGGVDSYAVAVFGKPGTGEFQWELTGRHLTMRADGDSVKNMAFGGPIVYGHGKGNPKTNLFHYQTKKANEVFGALNAEQVEKALLAKPPNESAVPLQGKQGKFPGVAVGELSSDQKDLVESVIKVILSPYRKEDVDESLSLLKSGGGLDKLHMAFYQAGDLGGDEVWDIWRVEGPSFVWHFRGAPHVHTYVNIGLKS